MKLDYLKPWPIGTPPEPALRGDDARLAVLKSFDLDGLENDPELAQITRFAAELCGTPIARVSLVEDVRQRFLTRTGLPETETPRNQSICAHAMLEAEPLVVPDLIEDVRFQDYPPVAGEPHLRFYAGAPLISHEGAPLGSLCVIDTKPRPEGLSDLQKNGLQVLAASVMRRLRHRREHLEQRAELQQSERRLRTLIDSLPDIAFSIRADGSFDYVNAQFEEVVGVDSPQQAEDWRPVIHPDDHEPLFTEWYDTFAKGEPFEGEFRLKQRDGSYRWSLTRVLPVAGDNDEGPRWFGTITDFEEAKRQVEARELLANELSHRIKNIFAVIGGLIRLKGRDYPDAEPFSEDINATLDTLNRAHSYVTHERANEGDTLQGLIAKLLAPYGDPAGGRLSLSGEDLPVSNRSTTALALVFHELATNSAKYGAFSVAEGSVDIGIKQVDGLISIRWQEVGGPPPQQELGTGFGSRLVERTVNGQLRGELNRAFEETGLVAVLTVPADAL
ncbi:PAS domain-containing protein [Pontixanthobacter sp. CEM42]|uniref:PAS domain-containing protein n=1 Tax=Pontixanthobacter sp. CEM42 TaxID=2792077 RepID=UPI001ADF73C6|nr:PAS domain-containing protein [Pontixanthobacter sp. CEM42]